MIRNTNRIRSVDLQESPYLLADVTAEIPSGTESAISFQFRLNHAAASGNGKGHRKRKKNPRSKQKPVKTATSDVMTVSPLIADTLYWDMSDLPDELLMDAKSLDITWYPEQHPPRRGPHGRGPGFDYRGRVFLDFIRVTNTVTNFATIAIGTKRRRLRLEHGPMDEVVIDERTMDSESGDFVYQDGARIPFLAERRASDKYLFTFDETAFRLGGGW